MFRRALGAVAVAAVLGIGLAGCGQVEDSSTDAAPTAGGDAGAFPVSIKHKFGTTEITKAPTRVVVVGTATDDLDAAIALGVTPVGFFNKSGSDAVPSWLQGKLDPAKTKIVNAGAGVDTEAVGALTPDLILATSSFGLDQEYPNLSKIAPTVGYAEDWGKQTWQEHVQVVAQALGKTAEAQKVIDTAQASITDFKAKHTAAAGKTFTASVGNAEGKMFTLVSPDDFAVKLLTEAGLTLSPKVADASKNEAGSPSGTVTPEQYDKLAADLVVVAFTTPELQKAFEGNQLAAKLKTGNYLPADMETITALRNPTSLDIPWILQKLEPGVAKMA
jgi:iron complex transport system substrate-binding protein